MSMFLCSFILKPSVLFPAGTYTIKYFDGVVRCVKNIYLKKKQPENYKSR